MNEVNNVLEWAQNEFWSTPVISDSEIALRVLEEENLDHQNTVTIDRAMAIARSILKMLSPPTSSSPMERYGWSEYHHALVRYAYFWATTVKKWTFRKVWIDMELPIVTAEKKQPPSKPAYGNSLPRPDIFIETVNGDRIWIECQTASSWTGLTEKAAAASRFRLENAYTTFVVVGPNPDSRYLDAVRSVVEEAGKEFLHVDPYSKDVIIPSMPRDISSIINKYAPTAPPTFHPKIGKDRFWAWKGEGSNRQPSVISRNVNLKVHPEQRWIVVGGPWPIDCPQCKGSGSASEDVRYNCPGCDGYGMVRSSRNNWEFCRLCKGAKTLPSEPCERCQGRGWEWDMYITQMRTPTSLMENKNALKWDIQLYPDDTKRHKLLINASVALDTNIDDRK